MFQTRVRYFMILLFIILFPLGAMAKEWRGVVPLKSTKFDVERLLGKPNHLGRYEIENERVSILYSSGPCEGLYQPLAKPNCECLVPKDTVLRLFVTFDSPVNVTQFRLNKSKYQRTRIDAHQPTATFSDLTEGVVYTILESDDVVTNIDYLPSVKDCEEAIRNQSPVAPSNIWQGIVPLRSTRAEVEQLLGPPRASHGEVYIYNTVENRVDVLYSSDPCNVADVSPRGMAADIVVRITVSPRKTMLVKNLSLDPAKYKRIQNSHPENWVHYLNSNDGIAVDAMINNGCEEVISIVYHSTARDRELRCRAGRGR